MASCPSDEALDQFLREQSDEQSDQAIVAHIEQCESCREAIRTRTDWGNLSHFRKYDPIAETVGFATGPEDTAVRERLLSIPYLPVKRGGKADAESEIDLPRQIDKYEVVAVLGRGGMGVVYLAYDPVLERAFAVKVITLDRSRQNEAVQRAWREVKAMGRLDHPNVVGVANAGELDDGRPFLVMEFLDGRNLEQVVQADGPMPVPRACRAVFEAARGLQHAHERGLIHRDVKPSNLIQCPDGSIPVLDFGLALLNQPSGQDQDNATQTGAVLGTVDFLSPEQALNVRKADARSDIYSLGCTLAFLLTGKRLFDGETTAEVLLAHRENLRPALHDLREDAPAGLNDVFQKLLATDPQQRFQSMAEVVEAFEPFVAETQPAARKPAGLMASWKAKLAGAAVLLGIIVVVIKVGEKEFRFNVDPEKETVTPVKGGNAKAASASDGKSTIVVDVPESKTGPAPIRLGEALLPPTARGRICNLIFVPGEAKLLSSVGGTVRLWDVSDLSAPKIERQQVVTDEFLVTALCRGRRDDEWITGTNNRFLRVHQADVDETPESLISLRYSGIPALARSKDGGQVFAGVFSFEGAKVVRWDLDKQENTGEVKVGPAYEGAGSRQVAMNPEGDLLAASDRGQVVLIDPETLEVKQRLEIKGDVTSLAFSSSGSHLAASSNGDVVHVWNRNGSRVTLKVKSLAGSSVAFSGDGRWLAIGTKRFITLLDAKSWTLQETKDSAMPWRVESLAFSDDGSLLAAASGRLADTGDGCIHVWKVNELVNDE